MGGEKQKIDLTNEGIDLRLEAFNERYKSQLKEFEEIALKDQKIEGKYLLLKSELDRVASERLNLIKKNESLDNEAEDINKDFKLLDEERKSIFAADKEIEKECEAIHAEFEKLSLKQESVVNLNEKVEKKSKSPSRRIGNMSKARQKTWSDEEVDSDEDSYGYEDDFSSGIDLPMEVTSGQ